MQPKIPGSLSRVPPKETKVVRGSKEIATVDGGDYTLAYQITGGKISSIIPLTDRNSLLISLDTSDDGELTITLPRLMIDAMAGPHNLDLNVLCDRERIEVHETVTVESRTVTIPFNVGSRKIEIIGSTLFGRHINPEPDVSVRGADELDKTMQMYAASFAVQTDQSSYAYGSDMIVTITNHILARDEQMALSIVDSDGNVCPPQRDPRV